MAPAGSPMVTVPPDLAGAAAPPEGVTVAAVVAALGAAVALPLLLVAEDPLEPHPAARAVISTAPAAAAQARGERERRWVQVGLRLMGQALLCSAWTAAVAAG